MNRHDELETARDKAKAALRLIGYEREGQLSADELIDGLGLHLTAIHEHLESALES